MSVPSPVPDLLDLLCYARDNAAVDGGPLPVQTATFLARALCWASEEHYLLTSERDITDNLPLRYRSPESEAIIVARERRIIKWDALCEAIGLALDTLTVTGGRPVEQATIAVAIAVAKLSGVQPLPTWAGVPALVPCPTCGQCLAENTCCP